MAVTTELSAVGYVGDGATVNFAAPFMFYEDADLLVVLRDADGADHVQTLGADYTVAGAGSPTGGTVTMLAAPSASEQLHIRLDPPLTQDLVLNPGSPMPAPSVERRLDLGVQQAQRLSTRISRALSIAETGEGGTDPFDAQGSRITNLGTPTDNSDAVTLEYALDNFATASGPAALPPDGSLTNVKISNTAAIAASKLAPINGAIMGSEADPYPGGSISTGASLQEWAQRVQYQMRRIMESIDGVARVHAYVDPAASNYVPAAIAAAVAAVQFPVNRIHNGSLMVSQRYPSESASLVLADGVDTFFVDRWFCLATGGTPTVRRVTSGLHTGARSPIGVRLEGAAGVTALRFGIRLGRAWCRSMGALLANKNVTFGCKVRHAGSTGSLTPTFVVRSSNDTLDDTSALKFQTPQMVTRVTQAFPGALGAGAEVAFTHTFDLGAMTNGQNGIECYVDFGAVNASTIQFAITDLWLSDGDLSSVLLPDDFHQQLELARTYYQKTFPYAVLPAGGLGISSGLLVMTGDSNAYKLGWTHAPQLRATPSITLHNPGGGVAGRARNDLGDDASATSASADAQNTLISFTPAGTKNRPWHIGAQADAEWYD